MNGFSTMWAVASAAERVIVMTKPVATKPIRQRTNSLPCHQGSSRSSIEIEPSPCGLSLGDALVHRQRAEQRDQHQDQRRDRRERAGGQRGDARLVARASRSSRRRSGTSPSTRDARAVVLRLVRPFGRLRPGLQQPVTDPAISLPCGRVGGSSDRLPGPGDRARGQRGRAGRPAWCPAGSSDAPIRGPRSCPACPAPGHRMRSMVATRSCRRTTQHACHSFHRDLIQHFDVDIDTSVIDHRSLAAG